MAKALKYIKTGMNLKVNTNLEGRMDKVHITGKMEISTNLK